MTIRWTALALMIAPLFCGLSLGSGQSAPQGSACRPSELTLSDAEILVYLLPESESVRKGGWDVGWELQTNPNLNQKDFFTFWVYNATRPSSGSVTIAYFAINKHTGDVWDTSVGQIVQSRDLSVIQKILRKGHCIDDSVIKTYGAQKPEGSS
jgi:hypothetical protein